MKRILVTVANGYLANYVYHENKDEFNYLNVKANYIQTPPVF